MTPAVFMMLVTLNCQSYSSSQAYERLQCARQPPTQIAFPSRAACEKSKPRVLMSYPYEQRRHLRLTCL
jgi:hypothetical protein